MGLDLAHKGSMPNRLLQELNLMQTGLLYLKVSSLARMN